MYRKTFLDINYKVLLHNIPKQMLLDDSSLSGLSTSGSIFSNGPIWLMVTGGVVVVIGYGNMQYF